MSTEAYILIGTLGGVIITQAFNSFNNYINKTHLTRENKKKAIIEAGLEHWKESVEHARQTEGIKGVIPLEYFMLHMSLLYDTLVDEKFDKEKFKKALAENEQIIKENRENFMNLGKRLKQLPEEETQPDTKPEPEPENKDDIDKTDPLYYDPKKF